MSTQDEIDKLHLLTTIMDRFNEHVERFEESREDIEQVRVKLNALQTHQKTILTEL
jgi:hypothetical protein